MTLRTSVVISIVTYKNADDVVNCLNALTASTYTDFIVIICENGGDIAFEDLSCVVPARLKSGQLVQLVNARENLGFAGGINRTLTDLEAKGADAVWVLNPDTLPSPHALERLMERLSRGDCDAVGSRVVLMNGRVQSYGGVWNGWLARANSIGFGSASTDGLPTAGIESRQNYLNGASMLLSQRFIVDVGFMREDYFLYCEEVEWFLRAKKKGFRLGFAADADIMHLHGTTTGGGRGLASASELAIYLGERNRLLVTRDVAPLKVPIVALTSVLMFLLRCIRQGDGSRLSSGLSGWFAGLRNVRGRPQI